MPHWLNVDQAMNAVLAMIMAGLGLSLTRNDFRNLLINPKALAVGLFAQMVLLPLLAVALIYYTDLDPRIKVGMIVISLCPGGITSNLVSFLVKGNVALAISLTVTNAFLTLFTIPLLTNLALNHFMGQNTTIELPFLKTMYEIFVVTILPAGAGVMIRSRFPTIAGKLEKPLNYVLPVLLLLVFLIKVFGPQEQGGTGITNKEIFELTRYAIALNLSSMVLGYLVGTIFRLVYRNKITISIEVGLHNTALALLISGTLLHDAVMQKPAVVYAIYSFVTTLLIAYGLKALERRFIRAEREESE